MKTYIMFLFAALLSMHTIAQTPATQTAPSAVKAPEKAKDINLTEVTIVSKKPLIVQEIDKTVVNVEAMISAAASNTMEVLEKTPGISINSNGEISLNGRSGVLVLIDGKNTYMSGQDLAAYLRSLPGGNLDKIELIDNPSAKYDASGNAIINIRLKKNRIGGLTGSVSLGASIGKYARNNDAVNLNYNHKKLNLFANLGYNYEKNYRKDHFDRRFFEEGGALLSTVDLQNNLVYKDRGFNANVGMDYTASAQTVYGFIFNVNKGSRNGMFDYESSDFDAKNQLERTGAGDTKAKDTRTNLGFNFNLQHKFDKKGQELSADINYLNYKSNGNQALQNFTYAPKGALIGQEKFRYIIPAGIDIYTAKADYVHPLKNKARLEAGFKSSIVDNDNVNRFYDVNGAEQTIDNSKSNHFKYHENINAVYLNGQKSWKRLGVQIGLRTENTMVRGRQLGNDEVQGSSFNKNYRGLFPSAYISYKLDTLGNNTLGLMAVRRITRPNYQLLNPFLFYRDQYSYTSGNPMLNPQYQSRIELKYQHKQFLNMGLSYNTFSDLIFQTTEAVNDVFTTRPKNIAGGFMLLLNTTVSTSPAKWWYLNYTARLSKIGMNGRVYTENLHFDVNILRLEINNYFTISPNWGAELGGYYASRDMTGQTLTKGMYRVNGAVQKKIWKGKGSLRVAFDDLFHSWVYNNKSLSLKQSEYFQTSESDSQRISFAMTYRFGKEAFMRKRRHNNNASDEEKGRID
ncbi:outer membrane beta-barrel family protein [Dyadobacter psychrophilus]|uniref:Outer membrane receptor proteins, mostly Fe transport n=1 Tax=Dyadobacter psychrophilus TaxID=651661 RepID=A0A1T5GLZ0_9BACT|nr:outer membrane beta-barrel family protein [Dyadobacter psychrophilus]SKC09436.1 Outer membrane receptor proteins, mostly Fe transport [Dyadobacter psychrophilus]